jgi:hypothetical protein
VFGAAGESVSQTFSSRGFFLLIDEELLGDEFDAVSGFAGFGLKPVPPDPDSHAHGAVSRKTLNPFGVFAEKRDGQPFVVIIELDQGDAPGIVFLCLAAL